MKDDTIKALSPEVAYSRGYAACLARVRRLETELRGVRSVKLPPEPDPHDSTIEYLISTAEVLMQAASKLIEFRADAHKISQETAHKTATPVGGQLSVVGSFEFPSFCWCFGMINKFADSAK